MDDLCNLAKLLLLLIPNWKLQQSKWKTNSMENHLWCARIVRTLFEKSNFCPKIQFWPKPQHFHEFFTQKINNFLGKSKLNFWTKNEDFEQCATFTYLFHTLDITVRNGFSMKTNWFGVTHTILFAFWLFPPLSLLNSKSDRN